MRETRLWGRFHDGVDRPLRIVRQRAGLVLLQIQCVDPCETVAWGDSVMVRHTAPVFIVAGPVRRGEPFFVAHGRFYIQQPRNQPVRTFELGVQDVEGGEPVARAADGLVFALATTHGAVPLGDAFEALGIVVRLPR